MKVLEFKGLVEKANGKLCEHSNESVAYNPRTRQCWSVTRHPENYNFVASQKQIKIREDFATRSKVVAYFVNLAKTEAESGNTEKMDALMTKRNAERLHSISAAAVRFYDKEKQMITFDGKSYAPGYVDPTDDEGSFGM